MNSNLNKYILRVIIVVIAFAVSGVLSFYASNNKVSMPAALAKLINYFPSSLRELTSPSPPDIALAEGSNEALDNELPGPAVTRRPNIPNSLARGDNHGEQYQCNPNRQPKGIQEVDADAIYRWTDDQGNVQFSDTAPEKFAHETVSNTKSFDFFSLDVRYPNGRKKEHSLQSIEVGGRAIYKVYAYTLPYELMTKSKIDVLIFTDKPSYDRYKLKTAPSIGNDIPGFYTSASNQAVIYGQKEPEQTYKISLHEVAHAIHAGNFGRTPKWYNEGMAEVFENTQVAGSQITIRPNGQWISKLGRKIPLMNLPTLLNSQPKDWNGNKLQAFYANAWSLSYFLMQPKNREFMRSLQVALAKDRCNSLDTSKFVRENYPGGNKKLETDWHRWQLNGQFDLIRF